jgi:polysaccharide biosynthesis/export protein
MLMNKCLFVSVSLCIAVGGISPVLAADTLPVIKMESPNSAYALGPEDQLSVHIVDLNDISDKPVRIDPNGYIELPLLGRVHAAGLTIDGLRNALAAQASRYIDSPQITINVIEYRSRPVSVLGEVNSPGLHLLQGPTRLVNVISLAGGLKSDAGQKLTITRDKAQGTLPLPGAHPDSSGQYSITDIRLNSLIDGSDPSTNIEVRANDIISISRANMVYVVGEVKKAGGIALRADDGMTLTQALSLAEGTGPNANPRKARILRAVDGKASNKNEIPVNLSLVMSGKAPDMQLYPNDVLFVPDNVPASAMKRATEAAIQIATGVMIYRR